jgi:OTU domain-containing protein 5
MPRCYGNHTEIQAMSELYNRNILVYCYSDGLYVCTCFNGMHVFQCVCLCNTSFSHIAEPINTFVAETSTEPPIRISYHNDIHYNAIIDPALPTFGVGLGFSDLKPGVCGALCLIVCVLDVCGCAPDVPIYL